MEGNFSSKVRDVIQFSREEALRLGHDYIGTEHLILGIVRLGDGIAVKILKNLNCDLYKLKKTIEDTVRGTGGSVTVGNIPLTKQAEKVLRITYLEAKLYKSDTIGTEHLLLSLLRDDENIAAQILQQFNITYDAVREELDLIISGKSSKSDQPDADTRSATASASSSKGGSKSSQGGGGSRERKMEKSKTPVLDNFGRDLTSLAEEGKLDPIVGREKEIERVAQVLSRRKKNNPVLIGEPGVGKSAIVEGLAMRIIQRKVSRVLFEKRVVILDLASIVAGTKYRGQFEERMKAILNELSKNPNIILFIDEIHTIVGAGGATGSLDAANMLKPALARGEIQTIGATTLDEYRQHIEKDGALERRFQKVMVDPTTPEETIEILNNIKERYEDHHNVHYTNEAIKACVYLTQRYISDRYLPDKAIDAMDEAGSRVHISNIVVPQRILDLEQQIEDIKQKKIAAVKNQNFESAANYRDSEKKMLAKLEEEKNNWEKEQNLIQIKVTGLKGGHSGVEIDKGRANSIKIIGRLLWNLKQKTDFTIKEIEGGQKHNAIPRTTKTTISTQKTEKQIQEIIKNEFQKIKKEYKEIDENMELKTEKIHQNKKTKTLTPESTEKTINLIRALPHGVIKMDPVIENLVRTSTNLAIIRKTNNQIKITMSTRSSLETELKATRNRIKSISKNFKCEIEEEKPYPGWKPQKNTELLQTLKTTYKNTFKKEPKIKAIHAGLETGIIGKKYKNMEMVSIGPEIQNPHTPQEKVNTKSVQKFWKHLTKTLKQITETKK